MITVLFFTCLGMACLYVFFTGKHALGLLLLIGFSQDSVRKLTPGEPIIFVVTVGVLFGFMLLGIWMRKGFIFSVEPFTRFTQKIQAPLMIFILIVFLQLIYSWLRYNNLVVGLIGLTTYLAPFLAVIVGYYLANSVQDIRRFMYLYVASGMIVALSVLASFIGLDWAIFQEVGAGLKIYDQGTVLKSHSGIMRTGEVAAWHISTAACLIVTLAVSSTKPRNLLIIFGIVGLLMLCVTLTGRRKMLMLASLFMLFYLIVNLYYHKTLKSKYFLTLFSLLIVIWFGFETISLENYSESLRNYISRSTTVFADATGRFVELGINPIQWAYHRVGLLGGGLGIASQGSYLFNMSNVAGASGEGGLGKIMVELGLPGLLIIIWLFFTITLYVDRCLKLSSQAFVNTSVLPLIASLAVLLAVNAVTFSVATQVYGDIFILILLGMFGGFVFAIPKIIMNSMPQDYLQPRAPQIQPRPLPTIS